MLHKFIFLSRTVGALLGAFLLARIAEIKYFRVNIVACIFSFAYSGLCEKRYGKSDLYRCCRFLCVIRIFYHLFDGFAGKTGKKANQISGLMITAVAGGGVVTPVIGFAIGTVGVIGGVFVTLACVCYLTYCAFGVKTAKA